MVVDRVTVNDESYFESFQSHNTNFRGKILGSVLLQCFIAYTFQNTNPEMLMKHTVSVKKYISCTVEHQNHTILTFTLGITNFMA